MKTNNNNMNFIWLNYNQIHYFAFNKQNLMKNKQILVTGATKGIGRATVERFALNGFDVVACARTQGDLSDLESWFGSTYPNQSIITFQADLSLKKDRINFCEKIKAFQLDVLVNNAGFFIPGAITLEDEGVLEKMIETNLYSAYDVTRACVSKMKDKHSGTIFNICSVASICAYENGGSYGISKFALLGFSKVLREELKSHNIRVTSVLPGATYTASWEGVEVPEERFIPAQDIAQNIWDVYKLSDRTVVEEIVIRPILGDL